MRVLAIGVVTAACLSVLGCKPSSKLGTPALTTPAPSPLEAEITADLRALHAATTKYLVAHDGVWPQIPEKFDSPEADLLKWWSDQLRPFGAKDTDWYVNEQKSGNDDYWGESGNKLSYLPTSFDAEHLTAYRWKTQPWFLTRFGPAPTLILPAGTIEKGPNLENIEELEKLSQTPVDNGPVPLSQIPEPLRKFATGDEWKDPVK